MTLEEKVSQMMNRAPAIPRLDIPEYDWWNDGEDPYLTSRLGVEFVKGLQGNDPKYLKVVATPKHYAVHSGPEPERHRFDAAAGERDLRETYLPAFRATVTEARAASVMCAYNRTNGEPCCANKHLLDDILRGEWGFNGYVVSDCGAIDDIYLRHHFVKTAKRHQRSLSKEAQTLSAAILTKHWFMQ